MTTVTTDPLYVYSGECRQCEVGLDAGFQDAMGNALRTGDIVICYTEDYGPGELTVVVQQQWRSYMGGRKELLEDPGEFFVMGIKSVPMDDPGKWRVRRLKQFEDVVDGEHWTAYGFNYRREAP